MILILFGGDKLTKNVNPDKYFHNGYGTRFDTYKEFSVPKCSVGKNVIIFGVDMSSSVRIDKKEKDILILVKDPTQGLMILR